MLMTLSGRKASQDEYELGEFIALLRARNTRSYCEIGAREGDTFHEIMASLAIGAHGVAVDWPGALWGKNNTDRQLAVAIDKLQHSGYTIGQVIGDSTAESTIDAVTLLGPYDAMLIDGDHTYEGVRADWRNYRDHARIVAFHDIVGHDQSEGVTHRPVEVPRLWAEIKAEGWPVREFIAPGSKMGIGVVFMDGAHESVEPAKPAPTLRAAAEVAT